MKARELLILSAICLSVSSAAPPADVSRILNVLSLLMLLFVTVAVKITVLFSPVGLVTTAVPLLIVIFSASLLHTMVLFFSPAVGKTSASQLSGRRYTPLASGDNVPSFVRSMPTFAKMSSQVSVLSSKNSRQPSSVSSEVNSAFSASSESALVLSLMTMAFMSAKAFCSASGTTAALPPCQFSTGKPLLMLPSLS